MKLAPDFVGKEVGLETDCCFGDEMALRGPPMAGFFIPAYHTRPLTLARVPRWGREGE